MTICATPYQWKHIIGQRVCRRNTDETRIVLLKSWQELFVLSPVLFAPGEIAKIPLGFGIEVPDGYAGYVFSRSGMAAKGLVCELPPVDSGYRGEIHAILSNVSSQTRHIPKGSRIGQLVITPVVIADFVTELGEQRGWSLWQHRKMTGKSGASFIGRRRLCP